MLSNTVYNILHAGWRISVKLRKLVDGLTNQLRCALCDSLELPPEAAHAKVRYSPR